MGVYDFRHGLDNALIMPMKKVTEERRSGAMGAMGATADYNISPCTL